MNNIYTKVPGAFSKEDNVKVNWDGEEATMAGGELVTHRLPDESGSLVDNKFVFPNKTGNDINERLAAINQAPTYTGKQAALPFSGMAKTYLDSIKDVDDKYKQTFEYAIKGPKYNKEDRATMKYNAMAINKLQGEVEAAKQLDSKTFSDAQQERLSQGMGEKAPTQEIPAFEQGGPGLKLTKEQARTLYALLPKLDPEYKEKLKYNLQNEDKGAFGDLTFDQIYNWYSTKQSGKVFLKKSDVDIALPRILSATSDQIQKTNDDKYYYVPTGDYLMRNDKGEWWNTGEKYTKAPSGDILSQGQTITPSGTTTSTVYTGGTVKSAKDSIIKPVPRAQSDTIVIGDPGTDINDVKPKVPAVPPIAPAPVVTDPEMPKIKSMDDEYMKKLTELMGAPSTISTDDLDMNDDMTKQYLRNKYLEIGAGQLMAGRRQKYSPYLTNTENKLQRIDERPYIQDNMNMLSNQRQMTSGYSPNASNSILANAYANTMGANSKVRNEVFNQNNTLYDQYLTRGQQISQYNNAQLATTRDLNDRTLANQQAFRQQGLKDVGRIEDLKYKQKVDKQSAKLQLKMYQDLFSVTKFSQLAGAYQALLNNYNNKQN